MKLGRAIRLLRATADTTQRETAAEIGISAAMLSRIESGQMCEARSMFRIFEWLIAEEADETATDVREVTTFVEGKPLPQEPAP